MAVNLHATTTAGPPLSPTFIWKCAPPPHHHLTQKVTAAIGLKRGCFFLGVYGGRLWVEEKKKPEGRPLFQTPPLLSFFLFSSSFPGMCLFSIYSGYNTTKIDER
jgi:hypothetical protein